MKILLENAVPEEQNKTIAKQNGTFLFAEGSYIQYLAHAITQAKDKMIKVKERL